MSTDVATDEEEPGTPVSVRHAPARLSAGLAVVAALLAVVTTSSSIFALMIGGIGIAGLLTGLFALGSRSIAGVGTGVIFAGVVVSGLGGGNVVFLVFGALTSILAFDLTQNAFGVGAQLTTATETWRGEIVHAAGSTGVGAVTVIVALLIYSVLSGTQLAIVGFVFLMLAATVLVWVIRS